MANIGSQEDTITMWSAHRLDDASISDGGTIITMWGHTKPLAAS